ncbi:hypothetical protein [Clostridium estertheticum]|uniref:hypothetical protein n=1 Tax=Clostridium estertheticum TaxID=238834 RepID=UPI001CF1B3CD|nr:hypothetical protein [Clostridium estertheticum]MCB2354467.1 hypothetical protein [Clostridium estertheticum]WAG42420.1 hypothetical protein LL065_07010 [Clostridium estertheticum]
MKERSKKIPWIISIVLIVCVVGIVIYKSTPKEKAVSVSNTVIKSLKVHNGKYVEKTGTLLVDKLIDPNGSFNGLSIFDYKLKSVSENSVNEAYTISKDSQTDSEFASEVKTYEGMYPKDDTNGQWTEDKSVDNQVTFTSGSYKVKQYNITYDVDYSANDGNKKESDVTLTTQEQTHGKNDFRVMDIDGIN